MPLDQNTTESLADRNSNENNISDIDMLFSLDCISGRDKKTLYLKICKDLTFEEIGLSLEANISAVKMAYYRALKKIRKYVIK